jgi:hypothetical protein
MMDAMAISRDQRVWARRLALGVVLVTCAGGAAFVLVRRPHGDCVVVGEMMRTYSEFQAANAPTLLTGMGKREELVAAAEAEAETAETLHKQAGGIRLSELRTAAVTFADTVASSAQAQLDDAEQPPELDPLDTALPELDPGELRAAEKSSAAVHLLLVACPSAPHPVGI